MCRAYSIFDAEADVHTKNNNSNVNVDVVADDMILIQ